MSSQPLNIIGAGPSGLSAAIFLAKAGREVHIHERYDEIGKRFQGDLQGLENWSSKEDVLEILNTLGLKTNFNTTPFCTVTFTNGKHEFQDHSPTPLFYLVKRGPFPNSLDTGLKEQAIQSGVNIHYRSNFPKEKADIIATGPQRQACIASDRGIVFQTKLPNMAVGIFHDDLAYLGYSYLLIADGYGCICTVVFKDFHRLNYCFERTLECAKRFANINMESAKPVGGVGSFVLNHPATFGKSLLVGEAAGLQDLLWGFGIRTAITSGHLAAHSILTGENYPKLLEKELQPALKASLVNRYLWEKLKWKSCPILPQFLRLKFSGRSKFRLLYKLSPIHRMLYPMAKRYIKKYYPNCIAENDVVVDK